MCPLLPLHLFFHQERLPKGNKDNVSAERPQHHPAAVCVCVVRPAVHGDRIHGERRPQHVPVTAGDREHPDTCQQHPFSQVNKPYTLCILFTLFYRETYINSKFSPPPLSHPSFSPLVPFFFPFSLHSVCRTSSTCRCRSHQG